MSVQDQYGNFVVRSLIVDSASIEVSTLARGNTANPARHIVEVENWSTIPYDVAIEVELPAGQRGLSFNGAAATWDAQIWSLAHGDIDRDECGLTAGGGAPGIERIHCSLVKWKKAQRHRWTQASGNLPLSLSVTVT